MKNKYSIITMTICLLMIVGIKCSYGQGWAYFDSLQATKIQAYKDSLKRAGAIYEDKTSFTPRPSINKNVVHDKEVKGNEWRDIDRSGIKGLFFRDTIPERKDTVPCILWYSDTSREYWYFSQMRDTAWMPYDMTVHWMFGYSVKSNLSVKSTYLDADKNKLPKSFIVIISTNRNQ